MSFLKFKENNEELSLIEIKDISKYKNLLSELEASTSEYKTLIDTIPEAICVLDYESKEFEYANNTFFDIFKIQDIENMDFDEIYNDLSISSGNINESIKYCLKIAKNWEMPENKMEMKRLLKLSSIHMSSYHNWNTFTFWFNDGKYCSDDFFCCHSLTCSCEIDLDENKIKNIEVQLEG